MSAITHEITTEHIKKNIESLVVVEAKKHLIDAATNKHNKSITNVQQIILKKFIIIIYNIFIYVLLLNLVIHYCLEAMIQDNRTNHF